MRLKDISQIMAIIAHVRANEKMSMRVGLKTATNLLIAMRAMLKAETPMLEKKKKAKSLQEISKSNGQL